MRTFEQLETRLPMTAAVDLDAGVLRVVGGDAAEAVEIRQIDVDSFRVLGDVDARGRYDGVTRLSVFLGGRADSLAFFGAGVAGTLPRGLLVDVGGGADAVRVSGLNAQEISTPPSVELIGGGGVDTLEIADSDLATFLAKTGAGNDLLRVFGCSFGGAVIADGGPGQDDLDENNNLFGTPPQFTGFES